MPAVKRSGLGISLLATAILLAVAVLYPGFFSLAKEFMGPSDKNRDSLSVDALRLENVSLKALLAQMQSLKGFKAAEAGEGLDAAVYSRYPFNFKDELLVSRGSKDGVLEGSAVVLGDKGERVLVGQIYKVFEDSSVVRTIFDSQAQFAVRLGDKSVDALLEGGVSPRLTFIPKEAQVSTGDAVYTASKEFSYGLAVGEIGELKDAADNLFREASVKVPYDIAQIRFVRILGKTAYEPKK